MMNGLALAQALVWSLTGYTLLGLGFALLFVTRGVTRVDPAARGTGWGFRLLLLPGAVALWPLLARRWWRGGAPPVERTAHRTAFH